VKARIARIVASVGGVGFLRPAPGTWGAAVALAAGYGLHAAGGPVAVVLATLAATLAGWWATAEATRGAPDKDPGWIVIDEVAGQWLTLWPVSAGAAAAGVEGWRLWPGWLAAFVLFRLFDIWKPGWVGRADRRGDALGVMLDDLVAGVFAALGVAALAALSHGVLMR